MALDPSFKQYDYQVGMDIAAAVPFDAQVFADQLQDRFGGAVFSFERSLPALAGKKLALSFRPASDADEQVIESYLPEPPADGSQIDPADLPDSLPGYLIHVVPEWSVDGQVVASGGEFALGEELKRVTALKPPTGSWQSRTKYLVAGEYQAIGLDGQGMPASRLSDLKSELQRVKTKLENEDFAGLTKHDLTGNLLQSGVLSWFALNDVQNRIAAGAADVVTHRLPSFGAFQLDLQTHYSFGIPQEVTFPGVLMDIGYSKLQIAAKDNDQQRFIAFNRAAGARGSANEHAVPEQLFSTPDSPVEGVSAVKALGLAAAEGQRIYTITRDNLDTALADLTLDPNTETDIRNAVNAGLQVTAHQHEISHAGFTGAGYILLDPETGSGAYKISGGADGSELRDAIGTALTWLSNGAEFIATILKSGRLHVLSDILSVFGIAVDFATLLSSCGAFDSIVGFVSSTFVGGGIQLLFSGIFLLEAILPLIAIVGVMVAGALVASAVAGRIIDGFVESCEQ